MEENALANYESLKTWADFSSLIGELITEHFFPTVSEAFGRLNTHQTIIFHFFPCDA